MKVSTLFVFNRFSITLLGCTLYTTCIIIHVCGTPSIIPVILIPMILCALFSCEQCVDPEAPRVRLQPGELSPPEACVGAGQSAVARHLRYRRREIHRAWNPGSRMQRTAAQCECLRERKREEVVVVCTDRKLGFNSLPFRPSGGSSGRMCFLRLSCGNSSRSKLSQ